MSVHVIGYFDQIIILITIASCCLVIRERIWSASVLISIGILVHETIIFVGYPSVLMLAFILQTKDPQATTIKTLTTAFIRRYRAIVLIPLICLMIVLVFQSVFLETAEVGMQVASHLETYDFISENRHVFVAYVLTASFKKQLMNQSQYCFHRVLNIEFLIVILLSLSLICSYWWRRASGERFKYSIRMFLFLVTLLPIFLHTVAWDTSRIWTDPLIVGVIGLWSICESFPQAPGKSRTHFPIVISSIMVIVLQIFATTELMDGVEERFSMVERIFLYAPSLILIGLAAGLQKSSSGGRGSPTD